MTYIWRLLKPKSNKAISFTVTILYIAILFFVLWPIMDNVLSNFTTFCLIFDVLAVTLLFNKVEGGKAHPVS